MLRIAWILVSVALSLYVAILAWDAPLSFASMVELIASVLAILVGVSLAVFTILAARPQVLEEHIKDPNQRENAKKILAEEDNSLAVQQYFLFCIFLSAIAVGIVLKFLSLDPPATGQTDFWLSAVSCAFGLLSSFSIAISVFLPSLAAGLVRQRRELG